MHSDFRTAAPTFTSRLLAWFSSGFQGASEMDMIGTLDEATIRAIAHDCGITAHQLVELAKAGPHGADEMIAMMQALNIDPGKVEMRYRDRFRDMQVNCGQCSSKAQCRHDLATGAAPSHFTDYCNNADHLSELRTDPDLRRG